jgi:hypothetical protein
MADLAIGAEQVIGFSRVSLNGARSREMGNEIAFKAVRRLETQLNELDATMD